MSDELRILQMFRFEDVADYISIVQECKENPPIFETKRLNSREIYEVYNIQNDSWIKGKDGNMMFLQGIFRINHLCPF